MEHVDLNASPDSDMPAKRDSEEGAGFDGGTGGAVEGSSPSSASPDGASHTEAVAENPVAADAETPGEATAGEAAASAPDETPDETPAKTTGKTTGKTTAKRGGKRAAKSADDADGGAAPARVKSLGKATRTRSGQAGSKSLTGAGVATSKALMSTKRNRPAKAAVEPAVVEADAAEAFDPATDLPMYREGMDWFVLRVASNKESSVRETLLRKVQIEGMETLVGRIMVPTEKTKTLKAGKQRITETKLYPGYVFVEMKLEPDGRIPQDVFFLIKETSGVGDFVGTAGRPTPMATHEVEKMLFDSRRPEEAPTLKMDFVKGDSVTIKEGPFENFRGTVDEMLPDRGLVRVLVTIFGRQAPIELEYWQIAKAEDDSN